MGRQEKKEIKPNQTKHTAKPSVGSEEKLKAQKKKKKRSSEMSNAKILELVGIQTK